MLAVFPPLIKLILLHTVVVLHYTHHIKWHALSKGERLSKFSKTSYCKSSLVSSFVQTCCVISFYSDMYTVCSYDTPQ